LYTCRLVSKSWKEESDRILKKRHTIIVSDDEKTLEVLQRLRSDPDYKFKVSELVAEKFHLEQNHLFLDLCSKLQSNLSSLVLRDVRVSLIGYRTIIRLVGPNLSQLELGTLKTVDGVYYRYFPVPDAQGRGDMVFPNMKNLEWMSYNDPPELASLFSSVCKAFPNLRKIRAFNIHEENPDHFEGLGLPQLKNMIMNFMPNDSPGTNDSTIDT
jgi:hypothetical protein